MFSLTDDTFFRLVQQRTENSGLPQERVEEIAAFCRYAYVGFFLQFLWNRMEADIDRSYYRKLADDAVQTISQYGDFEGFTV